MHTERRAHDYICVPPVGGWGNLVVVVGGGWGGGGEARRGFAPVSGYGEAL